MLDRRLEALQYLKRPAERLAHVHIVLGDGDDGEVAPPGNAGDEALVRAVAVLHVLHDHRAGVVGGVGVADIERYALFLHRLHRLLMQHRCAHERQLPQLSVGYARDGLRVVDDLRVRHQYAGHVRPVFIDVRPRRRCRQRAGYVAAAAAHDLYFPRRRQTVEPRYHDAPVLFHGGSYRGVAPLGLHLPVKTEEHAVLRVHEGIAEIIREELRREVFPARHKLVHAHVTAEPRTQCLEVRLHIVGDAKLVAYLGKAAFYAVHYLVARHAVGEVRMA